MVPPSLAIESMTYYHAGDVIVAAGGTLWVNNSVFELVQAFPNQRTVYIDGTSTSPGRLLISGSQVVSTKPINFVVQGYGTLEVTDTVLTGVNIVALENSRVVFRGVTLYGNITTAYDSRASIKIFDSDLSEPTTLSGYVVGEYTNTSVPSIKVEDDAVAVIYRWIHVTVYDGAGYPAPGVTVSTRYFINNTPASSGVSDAQGVARVNSIGTIIRETGSTFVGNYRVNATLTYAGHSYYGASEISVGVMPYGEPLGRNVTYAVMSLPKAFPDLTLVGQPLTVTPSNPKHGYNTYVNVTVTNIGPVPAHEVSAQFDDTSTIGGQLVIRPIGKVTIPIVPVGGSAVISTRWIAVPPLYPDSHTITATIDPDNTVPELVETLLVASRTVIVQNLSDVEVRSLTGEIYTVPSTIVVNVPVTLCASVHNVGDLTTGDVLVEFYDQPYGTGSMTLIANTTVTGIQSEHTAVASVTWTPMVAGIHTIVVRVNGGTDPNPANHSFDELRFDNNQASLVFTVLTPPDLKLTNMVFSPSNRIPGGDLVTISATLTNTEAAPVTSVLVELRRDSQSGPLVDSKIVTAVLSSNASTVVSFGWVTPADVTAATDIVFYMIVNPNQNDPLETTYSNNVVFGTLTVLDVRPDLAVTPSSIMVKLGQSNITASTFGRTVTVEVLVNNLGGRPANDFRVLVNVLNETSGYNHTFHSGLYNISATAMDHTTLVSFSWDIRIWEWGDYLIWVWVDSERTVSEPNENNNIASTVFTINPINAVVDITPDKLEYQAGDTIVVSMTIYHAGTSIVVPEVPNVVFRLVDTNTRQVVPGSEVQAGNATKDGTVVATLLIPTNLDSGSYDIVAVFFGTTYADTDSTADTVHISAAGAGGLLPMWMIIVIVVIVAAVIGGVSVYMYRYGLGKYVECGECGQFIPASSKRCPKCGVEFEVGTMKCSECGAWIPAESTECPNCGVKFVGEAEEEADYLERMRKEYDEMVSKYRELAKPELGKKFSDKAFEEWWKKQPGYISFEDWLAKEEEKKKEGPVPCPVCGTLNPKEATVCHKCGTVFGAVKEAPTGKGPPPAAPPAAAAPPAVEKPVERPAEGAPPAAQAAAPPGAQPRMVIRRPIEKKVVPKKIIRTPTGELKEEEESKGDENQ
ncbi:MAG: CARDB domain-containing protein [Thermoplasmata archaeon]